MQLPASPVRQLLIRMLKHALDAVNGGKAVQQAIHKSGDVLTIGSRRYDLRKYRRIVVVGGGKAAASMARAIEPIPWPPAGGGVVITKYGHTVRTKCIRVVEAAHPPDRAGLAAARGILSLASSLTREDLLVVLLSGGASSLMPSPVSTVTLADKQHDQIVASVWRRHPRHQQRPQAPVESERRSAGGIDSCHHPHAHPIGCDR